MASKNSVNSGFSKPRLSPSNQKAARWATFETGSGTIRSNNRSHQNPPRRSLYGRYALQNRRRQKIAAIIYLISS